MRGDDPRRVALRALSRIRRDDAFSGPVLARELSRSTLDARDAAYATRLTYGVLATAGTLDDALRAHVRRLPEPRVWDVLRVGTYELLYLRTPAYAVVAEAVAAARAVRAQSAGMVNAVLRRVAEDADGFPWGDPSTDRDALGRLVGAPRWLVDVVLESLGVARGTEALESLREPAPTFIRVDPFAAPPHETVGALADSGLEASPPDPECYRVDRPPMLFRELAGRGGWFAMDAAAQVAPYATRPLPSQRVCDVGAGRGNKTVCLQALATRVGSPASIVAVDVHPGKSAVLSERLAHSGVPGVCVETCDVVELDERFGHDPFDAVLLDAPCTGLGTLRRYPEKRWRLAAEDVGRMSAVQDRMIASAARVVRPGGRLVYSTCSVARQENAGTIERFLAGPGAGEFSAERLDAGGIPGWEPFFTPEGYFQSWPAVDGPDGHFVAVMRRTDRG